MSTMALCMGQIAAAEITPTLIVCICVGVVAVIIAAVLLALLLIPYTLTLKSGDKTWKEKHMGHVGLELSEPKRDGYKFEGWFEDESFTKPVGKTFRMPRRHTSLYAKWTEENIKEPVEELEASETSSADGLPASAAPQNAPEEITPEKPAEEPVLQEPAEESFAAVEENAEEHEEPEDEGETGEGDEIDNALVTLVTGAKVFVQYRRSFRARLIQAADETKEMYNRFRNEVLSYIGVKERVSWNYDSFNVGRRQFVKMNANTKSLIVYFALDPASVGEKYRFRNVSEKKRYAAVPVRYKITGSRSMQYALELLEQTAGAFGLDFKRTEDNLVIPYETREELIRQRLIKVYAKRETGESVTEEQLEEYIAEGATVEPLSAYTVTDEVAVNEAESLITDATAKQLIALAETKEARVAAGKRTYINLDTVSANYREGETVDLESLKAKGLIDRKAVSCKVLARGKLDKALTIEAADFSLPAVKMIVLTGGKVVKVKRESAK